MPERRPNSDSDADLFAWAESWLLSPDEPCPTWMAGTVFDELEKTHLKGYGRLSTFAREFAVYEILHENLVQSLANLLSGELLVLEVGAGNGLLSKFLRDAGVNAVATDNYSWKMKRRAPVRRMRYNTAVDHYNPSCVVCCWMPYGADWTPAFRACPSVQRYVLIGEGSGGCCGSDETWGGHVYDEDTGEYQQVPGGFEKDGWSTYEWPAANLCRTDYRSNGGVCRHSSIQVFERPQEDSPNASA